MPGSCSPRPCGSSRWPTTPSCARPRRRAWPTPPDDRHRQHRHRHARLAGGGRGLGPRRRRCSRRSPAPTWSPAGAKARGAIRAAGLVDQWSPESESCDEVSDASAAAGRRRRRRSRCSCTASEQPELSRGAARPPAPSVIEVPVYRWAPPIDPAPLQPPGRPDRRPAGRRGHLHLGPGGRGAASPPPGRPGPRCWTRCARDVLAACVGPVTAAPLRRGSACRSSAPARARLGALVRALDRRAAPAGRRRCRSPGTPLALRGHARGRRRRAAAAAAGTDGGAAGAGRRTGPGALTGPRCWRRCPAAPTSTPSRWRWPGSGSGLGAPGVRPDRGQARLPPGHRLISPR